MGDLDLALRAVACRGWRWLGGAFWYVDDERGACPLCSGAGGFRWMEADGSENGEQCPCAGRVELYPGYRNNGYSERMAASGAVPDLTDHATLGVLLALVREAWGDPLLSCAPMNTGQNRAEAWAVYSFHEYHDETIGVGPTEAAALVAALERAP